MHRSALYVIVYGICYDCGYAKFSLFLHENALKLTILFGPFLFEVTPGHFISRMDKRICSSLKASVDMDLSYNHGADMVSIYE